MKTHGRRNERGQVMILGILALILLLLAVFLLFDVQSVIRGKIKGLTAVDAAALTGANWQRNTLNIVGELNLVKASTVLISDEIFGIGASPSTFLSVATESQEPAVDTYERYGKLKAASDTVSQMQYRILFICPLIGMGAAQQAAKNNGMNYNATFGKAIAEQVDTLNGGGVAAGLYDKFKSDSFAMENLYGFQWQVPYISLLSNIAEGGYGIAVLPNARLMSEPTVYTAPRANPDFSSYISSQWFYEAVRYNYWCWLETFLDRMQSRGNGAKWWGDLKVSFENAFRKESEYLPVGVTISTSDENVYSNLVDTGLYEYALSRYGKNSSEIPPLGESYDWKDPVYDSDGNVIVTAASDAKLDPLPAIDWAYYNSSWYDYSNSTVDLWDEYLKSSIRSAAQYHSGAVSRMDIRFKPVTVSGYMGTGENATDSTIGEGLGTFRGSGSALSRLSTSQRAMRKSVPSTYAYSLAKPFGSIEINGSEEPPHHSRIVLPVFHKSALIPVALENPGKNPLVDYDFYLFLLYYVPVLGETASLDSMPPSLKSQFAYYHALLKKADDASWRQEGINWLDTVIYTAYDSNGNPTYTKRNRDNCKWQHSSGGTEPNRPMPLH